MTQPVEILLAIDDAYAMPAAVTLRSLIDHLDPSRDLRVHVFCVRVGRESRSSIQSSLEPACGRVELRWYDIDGRITGTSVLGADSVFPPVVLARLALAELLPPSVRRVLYLDADLLVRSDVAALWDTPLAGRTVGAVLNFGLPTAALAEPEAALRLGIPRASPYFNSGVMLVDVARWRETGVSARLAKIAEALAGATLRFPDQSLLNAALHADAASLHPGWNAWDRLRLYVRSGLVWPHISWSEAHEAIRRPRIVHFAMTPKPWHPGYVDPLRGAFFEVLDRTAWRGWRPRRARLRDLARALLRRSTAPVVELGRLGSLLRIAPDAKATRFLALRARLCDWLIRASAARRSARTHRAR